jgi:hypothetical protein
MHIYGTSDLNLCKHRTSVILNQDLRDSKMDHNINPTNDLTDQEREILLAKAKDCLDIIDYQHNGTPYNDRKGARTKPNQRLVEAFGISNAFTNVRPGPFSNNATKKMKAACKIEDGSNGEWTDLRTHAMGYLTEYLYRKSDSKSIYLAELVQFITLKLSLSYLFDNADAAFKSKDIFKDIVLIGREINTLWANSKKPDNERLRWEDQHELHKALCHVTTAGDFPGDLEKTIMREHNPLNYILPAYETMWRVVMRSFIEVQLRSAADSSVWRIVLAKYLEKLKDPGCMPEAFKEPLDGNIRPIDIAKEGLRLYPPSCHVHREYHGELVRADIEACHLAKLLGGNDPLVFRPERWQQICKEERDKASKADQGGGGKNRNDLKIGETKLGFMPFATTCRDNTGDTKGFGMKMIVMLVAVLCDGLGDDWKVADEGSLPPLGVALESSREAYLDLTLEKM